MNEREGKFNYRKIFFLFIKINVGLYFEFLNLNDFDEICGCFECNGMLRMNWLDKCLFWDFKKFNNIFLMFFMLLEVWKL